MPLLWCWYTFIWCASSGCTGKYHVWSNLRHNLFFVCWPAINHYGQHWTCPSLWKHSQHLLQVWILFLDPFVILYKVLTARTFTSCDWLLLHTFWQIAGHSCFHQQYILYISFLLKIVCIMICLCFVFFIVMSISKPKSGLFLAHKLLLKPSNLRKKEKRCHKLLIE